MIINAQNKEQVKGYCRHSWAAQGKLTKEISDQICAEDDSTLRRILEDQKARIVQAAETIEDIADREITLSQAESIQEVIDNLEKLLKC
ncbi:MAG: hypothetical protein Q8S94_11960 [Pseudohongiella sp.]|nr:hypothetical protein [Pseudohongiella sp.]